MIDFSHTINTTIKNTIASTLLETDYLLNKYPNGVVISKEIQNLCTGLSKHIEIPVLISGETGTGKGYLVQYLSNLRRENNKQLPVVSVNCALLNNDVAQSTIFGHCKGAFTGAQSSSIGAVGESDGGIFFLDEVHCLNIDNQRKLLRLLDNGSYTRVGESLERKANFQVISASNINLEEAVSRGEFILDLYMRIKGVEIDILPLHLRQDEIDDIVASYFRAKGIDVKNEDYLSIVEKCKGKVWPGNIRQLFYELDSMRFKASINESDNLDSFFCFNGELLSNESDRSNGTGSVEYLELAIEEHLCGRQTPLMLERVMESIEAMIIKYTIQHTYSIQEVMDKLYLSRGKLDFKRRKYNLM